MSCAFHPQLTTLQELSFLKLLAEARLLEKPTVGCLLDWLIGKRQPTAGAQQHLESADGSLGSISPIQKYMLRLVLFGVGKTIMRRGRLCEVVETHGQLRRLMPLINKDLSEAKDTPFWIPRTAATRKEKRAERIHRQYVGGLRTFTAPHYTGDSRPKGARRVELRSNFPSTALLTRLVRDYSYNGRAAFAATVRGHLPQLQIIDRRGWRYSHEVKRFVRDSGVGGHSDHPYIPLAPDRETAVGGGYTKTQVTAALAKHPRWNDKHSAAVFEVVYMRREPRFVAASLGLRLETVYRYCSRVRADLGEGIPQEFVPGLSDSEEPFCT